MLAGIPASLWILGVRDWRCYGAAFLWGAAFHAVQTGNVTVPLLLLTAPRLAGAGLPGSAPARCERARDRDKDHLLAAHSSGSRPPGGTGRR